MTETNPTFDDKFADTMCVPRMVFDTLLHTVGYQQWLSPNADIEYAQDARSISTGIYGALFISRGQYDQSNRFASEPDWETIRECRERIFEEHFYCPHKFGLLPFETPDDMFDAVEAALVAHDLIHDVPPERETTYVEVDP